MFKGFCQRISFSLQRGFEVQSRAVGGVHSCLHVSQRMGSSLSGLTASPAHCGRAGDQRPRPLSLLQHLRLRGVLRKGPGGAGEGHGGHVHPREDEAQAGQDLHGLPRAAEVGKLRGDGSPATARACPSLCPRAPRVTCPRPAAPSAPVTTCPLCRRPEPDPTARGGSPARFQLQQNGTRVLCARLAPRFRPGAWPVGVVAAGERVKRAGRSEPWRPACQLSCRRLHSRERGAWRP